MAITTGDTFRGTSSRGLHFIDGPVPLASPEQPLHQQARSPAAFLPGAVLLPGIDATALREVPKRDAFDLLECHRVPDDWPVVRLLLQPGPTGPLSPDAPYPAAGIHLLSVNPAEKSRGGANKAYESNSATFTATLSTLPNETAFVLGRGPPVADQVAHLPDVLRESSGTQRHQLETALHCVGCHFASDWHCPRPPSKVL